MYLALDLPRARRGTRIVLHGQGLTVLNPRKLPTTPTFARGERRARTPLLLKQELVAFWIAAGSHGSQSCRTGMYKLCATVLAARTSANMRVAIGLARRSASLCTEMADRTRTNPAHGSGSREVRWVRGGASVAKFESSYFVWAG